MDVQRSVPRLSDADDLLSFALRSWLLCVVSCICKVVVLFLLDALNCIKSVALLISACFMLEWTKVLLHVQHFVEDLFKFFRYPRNVWIGGAVFVVLL